MKRYLVILSALLTVLYWSCGYDEPITQNPEFCDLVSMVEDSVVFSDGSKVQLACFASPTSNISYPSFAVMRRTSLDTVNIRVVCDDISLDSIYVYLYDCIESYDDAEPNELIGYHILLDPVNSTSTAELIARYDAETRRTSWSLEMQRLYDYECSDPSLMFTWFTGRLDR